MIRCERPCQSTAFPDVASLFSPPGSRVFSPPFPCMALPRQVLSFSLLLRGWLCRPQRRRIQRKWILRLRCPDPEKRELGAIMGEAGGVVCDPNHDAQNSMKPSLADRVAW